MITAYGGVNGENTSSPHLPFSGPTVQGMDASGARPTGRVGISTSNDIC